MPTHSTGEITSYITYYVERLMKTTDSVMRECPFCPMFHGEDIIDIEPLNPVVKGHRLVIPKEHVTDFVDSPEVSARVMEYASNLAKKLGGDYNLITSKGRYATQTVYHLHIHLVPRKENDNLLLPWSHSLAEAKKEWVEEIRKDLQISKEILGEGGTVGILSSQRLRALIDTQEKLNSYFDLLTGDNPEEAK